LVKLNWRMAKRISTLKRHECPTISGKVWHLLLDGNGNPSCGYCMKEVFWGQVAEHHQHLKGKRGRQ